MLDSLLIKNFRSLEHLEVPKLGRVNLMVGKNNSGKSTVLEALRIYAGHAQRQLLEAIAIEHDEPLATSDADLGATAEELPFQALFTDRHFPANDGVKIEIGSATQPHQRLTIEHVFLVETEEKVDNGSVLRRHPILKAESPDLFYDATTQALQVVKGEKALPPILLLPASSRVRGISFDSGLAVPCSLVPTQFISEDELALEWDKVALTSHEETLKRAMRIVTPDFENLAFVRNPDGRSMSFRTTSESRALYRQRPERSAKVKLAGAPTPVPLNSMGDGMLRVLQQTLKLLAAKGGFLLIDEFENGLHYSVQEKVWELVFDLARQLNVQVFATTHSWDCIDSFTKVAVARTETDGVLFRLGRSVRTSDQGRVIATVFDEAALQRITQQDVEVR